MGMTHTGGVSEEAALATHLGLTGTLHPVDWSSSELCRKIELFTDFVWLDHHKTKHVRFANYMTLGDYIRKNTGPNRSATLVLTKQDGVPEGKRTDLASKDIFVVNYDRYCRVAEKDAAAAYFAGLQGTPIIDRNAAGTKRAAEAMGVKGLAELASAFKKGKGDGAAPSEDEIKAAVQVINDLSTYALKEPANLKDISPATADLAAAITSAREYGRRVEELADFEANLDNSSEDYWHDFISRNEWMFGHSLEFRYLKESVDKPLMSEKNIKNRGGIMADKELASEGELEFTVLLEIKTPMMPLVSDKPYRKYIHPISGELADAVSQALVERSRYMAGFTTLPDKRGRWQLDGPLTFHPRTVLLAGLLSSLKGEEGDDARDMKDQQVETFSLFRSGLQSIEVITFDEMLKRAKRIIGPGPEQEDPPPTENSAPSYPR